ncbi:MAG: hypothetical protein GXY36_07525 [Chloroflexi bacterium]|nr:hypothetical protein [Chloroflexota bacterium]
MNAEPGPSQDVRGTLLSDHPHPRPWQRQLTALLVLLALVGDIFGVIGLLALAAIYALPLLPLAAFFLAALLLPLLLLTVLHPRVTVYERGLWIKPLLWPGRWLPWDAVRRLEDHTLVRRGQTSRRAPVQDGRLIVADGLPAVFATVGILAGLGRARAFGISTYSHTGYEALLKTIQRHTPRR